MSNDPYLPIKSPMTVTDSDITAPDSVLRELAGAYVAQHEANKGAARPHIRLLLANIGSEAKQWRPVVDQLKSMRKSDNLVAVAGLGQTDAETTAALDSLRRARIPVIGSTVTGDNLSRPDGFARAAPTNGNEAQAAIAYTKRNPNWHTVMLVQDTKPGELYASTLGQQVQAALRSSHLRLVGQVEQYDSGLAGYPSRFPQISADICINKPDVVYFAGRGLHLAPFIKALAGRTCQYDTTVTVLTGDDASQLASDDSFRSYLDSRLTVRYSCFVIFGGDGRLS